MSRKSKAPVRPRRARKPTPTPARLTLRARVRGFVTGLAPLLGVMLVVRVALAEPYHIPSPSMAPTLLPGDWLYVNKLRYGPHIPLTHARLPGYAEPRRGDVVVFVSPPQVPEIRITPNDVTPTLVKRIVGEAGDTLYMRGGQLFVNGIAERRVVSVPSVSSAESASPSLVGNLHKYQIHGTRFGEPPQNPTSHEWGPVAIPRNDYFMMGDNRDDSIDSRYYGLVPRENIRGTPMFVYYSYDTERGLDWFRALTDIRWRRIGTIVR